MYGTSEGGGIDIGMEVPPETKPNSDDKDDEAFKRVEQEVKDVKNKLNIIIDSLNKGVGNVLKKALEEVKLLAAKLDVIGNPGVTSTTVYTVNKRIKLATLIKYDSNKKNLPGQISSVKAYVRFYADDFVELIN